MCFFLYKKEHFGKTNPYTCLVIKLDGVDPDDSVSVVISLHNIDIQSSKNKTTMTFMILIQFSSVPYEKGFTFLDYLQGVVGGAAKFEPFLKAYIKQFSFKGHYACFLSCVLASKMYFDIRCYE